MAEHEQDRPNQAANQEPAEGSRETIGNNGAAADNTGDNTGGITNRPLSRERREQEELPPRGERKDGGSHA